MSNTQARKEQGAKAPFFSGRKVTPQAPGKAWRG